LACTNIDTPPHTVTAASAYDHQLNDDSGHLYVADTGNHRVVKVVCPFSGTVQTVAGTGDSGSSGDGGAATSAYLDRPPGVEVDASGNMYVADLLNCRVRLVTKSTGIIRTFAGGGGSGDDGGAVTSADLCQPRGLALDSTRGVLHISQAGSLHRIRAVSLSSGIISTVAGTGSAGWTGDGGPTTSALPRPSGLAVDSKGNLIIVDTFNNVIRYVQYTSKVIYVIAGTGVSYSPGGGYYLTSGSNGDGGPATSAKVSYPNGIALDEANGRFYIADSDNYVVRTVAMTSYDTPTLSPTPMPTGKICPAGSYVSGAESCCDS
jgi:DNA-binding beta-propeller fold protein YncE